MFGIGSILRIGANPNRAVLYIFYAFIMFGDAAAMLLCVFLLNKRKQYAFLLSMIVLSLNVFLTIFDQFGLVDLLFFLLNLITLAMLIIARKEFLPA